MSLSFHPKVVITTPPARGGDERARVVRSFVGASVLHAVYLPSAAAALVPRTASSLSKRPKAVHRFASRMRSSCGNRGKVGAAGYGRRVDQRAFIFHGKN